VLVGRRKQSAGGGVGGREAERVSDLHLGRGRDEANSDASRFGAADQARIGTERTRRARWRLRRNDERQATISGGQHVVRRLERVGQHLEAALERVTQQHQHTNAIIVVLIISTPSKPRESVGEASLSRVGSRLGGVATHTCRRIRSQSPTRCRTRQDWHGRLRQRAHPSLGESTRSSRPNSRRMPCR